MRFVILKTSDDSNVMGGELSEDNVYICAYPKPIKDNKHPTKLAVGESSLCEYSLSGSKGVYRVVRID